FGDLSSLAVGKADAVAGPVVDGQEAAMVFGKGCIGIQRGKQVGVEPLRQLLDGKKFVWAVVELVPNAVKIPRLLCRDTGVGITRSEPFELLARQVRIRPWSKRNPVATRHIG